MVVQLDQCRIERGRLPGPRGSGDWNEPVRPQECGTQDRQVVRLHPKALEIQCDPGAVENAQHHILAMQRGKRGDTQIDVRAIRSDAYTTVLRETRFGNVETRENLDAARQWRLHALGVTAAILEQAVEAVADLDHLFQRLDMYVRCAEARAAPDDVIGEFGGGGVGLFVERLSRKANCKAVA